MCQYFYNILCLTAFLCKFYETLTIFFTNKDAEIFSTKSNVDIDRDENYWVSWKNLEINNISINKGHSTIIYPDKSSLVVKFGFDFCDMTYTLTLVIFFKCYQKKFHVNISLTFEDRVNLDCEESYFAKHYLPKRPNCIISFGKRTNCTAFREKKYAISSSTFDNDNHMFVNNLTPINNKYTYNYTFSFVILIKNDLFQICHLSKNIRMYYIDETQYLCNLPNLPVRILEFEEFFSISCVLNYSIPFINKVLKFIVNNYMIYKWEFTYKNKYSWQYNPYQIYIYHNATFRTWDGLKEYTLRRDRLYLYEKITSKCEKIKRRLFILSVDECLDCRIKSVNVSYLYMKVDKILHQPINSYNSSEKFCPGPLWIPQQESRVIGAVYLINLDDNLKETYRKIYDVDFDVKLIVFRNLKILPVSDTINLPQVFTVNCLTDAVLSIHLVVVNITSTMENKCEIETEVPVLDIKTILLQIYINYNNFWFNYTKFYYIGRKPTILIINSRYPKLLEYVKCYTDGENDLYRFRWTCNNSNEPKSLVAGFYITTRNDVLIFEETCPLMLFDCTCVVTFVTFHNETIFSVSAFVDLDLKENELANCELHASSHTGFKWGNIILYLFFLIMIPGTFLMIILIVTKGISKDSIEIDIIHHLGFVKKDVNLMPNVIPKYFLSKSDIGTFKFEEFLSQLREFERMAKLIKFSNAQDIKLMRNSMHCRNMRSKSIRRLEDIDLKNEKMTKREAIQIELLKRYHFRQEVIARTKLQREKHKSSLRGFNTISKSIRMNIDEQSPREETESISISENDTLSWYNSKAYKSCTTLCDAATITKKAKDFQNFTVPLDELSSRYFRKKHSRIFYTKLKDSEAYLKLKNTLHMEKLMQIVEEKKGPITRSSSSLNTKFRRGLIYDMNIDLSSENTEHNVDIISVDNLEKEIMYDDIFRYKYIPLSKAPKERSIHLD